MKITLIIVLVVIILLVIWSIIGYFSSRVEQAKYTVIKNANGYEIRNYPAHIVAETTVSGPGGEALNKGFSIVAGYIFGGNVQKQSIAMTAPVIARKDASEKIAMTAPVVASKEGDMQVISFGMPSSYSLSTLPMPTDPNVKLVEIPEEKVAVVTSSWYRTDSRVQNMEKELLSFLTRDGIKTVGPFSYAGYNAPWTPPWMLRNEVMIQIQ